MNAAKEGRGEPAEHDFITRKIAWSEHIYQEEIQRLRSLPPEHNINKPGCDFWYSIFALAGLVKGGYFPYRAVLNAVRLACSHVRRATEREIEYQFKRAYARCKPKRFQP